MMSRRSRLFLASLLICVLSTLAVPTSVDAQARVRTAPVPKAAPAPPKKSNEQLEKEIVERHIRLIEDVDVVLDYIPYDQAEAKCVGCHVAYAGTPIVPTGTEHAKCLKSWEAFYSKPEIDVRVVFGYGDESRESVVDDPLTSQILIDQLTKPCASNVAACGFKRSVDDAELFEKVVKGPSGTSHTVKLRLVTSAYSSSDVINRAFLSDQERKSAHAKQTFLKGIEQADALFYVGHARDGGGPDFSPAKRNADGTINYPYYHRNKPGLEELTAAMSLAKKSPKIMGLLACNSDRWRKRFSGLAPKSGLILSSTEKIASEVVLAQVYGALDAILWKRCENSFNESLNPVPKQEYAGSKIQKITLSNFFDQAR